MSIFERFISIVAPHECLTCGREGALLCAWCLPGACAPLPECCYRCQKLSTDSRVCASCRRISRLKHVWVRTEYGSIAKQLIYNFKFQRVRAASEPLAELLSEALPYLPSDTIVSYVPTATSRYRQRGYDQSQLLARTLARKLKLPFVPLLSRSGQARQVGARRSQRLRQLEGAFRPRNTYTASGASVLLVDDIVTTGATLEAAARALKAAGAKTVNAAVFAQKK